MMSQMLVKRVTGLFKCLSKGGLNHNLEFTVFTATFSIIIYEGGDLS